MRLKNTIEDIEKRGNFRRLVESNRNGGVITHSIDYLHDLLGLLKASSSTAVTVYARRLISSQMNTEPSTVASTEQIKEKIGETEARIERLLQVVLFQCAAYGDADPSH